jgi:hypothetical protein
MRHQLQPPVSEASSRRRAVASRVRQPFGRPPPNGRGRPPAVVTAPRAVRVAFAAHFTLTTGVG